MRQYVYTMLAMLIFVASARAFDSPLENCMTPAEYTKGNHAFKIEVTHYRHVINFHVFAEGDTYEMMSRRNGYLWVYDGSRTIVNVPIAAYAHDGIMGYNFNISRDYLATSAFQFRFGRQGGKILLGDYAEIESEFAVSLEIENTTVPQGKAVRGKLIITSAAKYCLQFPDDCILGYEFVNVDGDVLPRSRGDCGQMIMEMKFEQGDTKSLNVKIPTYIDYAVDDLVLDDGYMPAGSYNLKVYLEGHRDMALESAAKITVTPR